MDELDTRPVLMLPHEIVVMGHRYHIEVVENRDDSLGRTHGAETALGLTELNTGKIRIRGGGEQSEDAVRDTLLHEVMHIVAHLMCEGLDEETVGRMSTGLLLTLRSNPQLVAALISR